MTALKREYASRRLIEVKPRVRALDSRRLAWWIVTQYVSVASRHALDRHAMTQD